MAYIVKAKWHRPAKEASWPAPDLAAAKKRKANVEAAARVNHKVVRVSIEKVVKVKHRSTATPVVITKPIDIEADEQTAAPADKWPYRILWGLGAFAVAMLVLSITVGPEVTNKIGTGVVAFLLAIILVPIFLIALALYVLFHHGGSHGHRHVAHSLGRTARRSGSPFSGGGSLDGYDNSGD